MSFRYTRSGTLKTLTQGATPPGWPQEVIPWDKYEGSYRSELYKNDITVIIVALLRGANYDPAMHIEDSSHSSEPQCPFVEQIPVLADEIEYKLIFNDGQHGWLFRLNQIPG